MLLQF